MTAKELTEKLNLNKSAVTEWKNRKTKPSIESAIGISQIFNISLDWLLTGEEKPTSHAVAISVSDLSDTEEILLKEYRAADKEKRRAILQAALNTMADKTALGETKGGSE
jgi:transcriptional regulator with XRE-family HTH domain